MPKYLVIDTETTGLFDFTKPADAEGQPRLAELAAIEIVDDGNTSTANDHHFFIRPDGWQMRPEAAAINGLTDEYLEEHGVPVADVLAFYAKAIESGGIIVAHNAQYDTKIMRGEMRRAGLPDLFEKTPNICTMRGSLDQCKLSKKKGGGYKLPKLEEAYRHFAGSDMPPITRGKAMRDARCCMAIFDALADIGALPDPAVHYAKNRPTAPPDVPSPHSDNNGVMQNDT